MEEKNSLMSCSLTDPLPASNFGKNAEDAKKRKKPFQPPEYDVTHLFGKKYGGSSFSEEQMKTRINVTNEELLPLDGKE